MIQFTIQKVHVRVALLALLVLFSAALTFSQQKERNRKLDAAQKGAPAASAPSAKDDKDEGDPLFKGMKYRSIGPFRGGRSLTAAGIPGDPTTYYFGATGGGVWKSTDGANTWAPVFDKDGAPSSGSIAVAVSDPNVVYVGTGEACIRGNISQGDGVWKSVDAGKSWKNVGLKDSRAIGKVIVNPRNPDIVFVAALGHPFGPNMERGVFRTTDGGKTWDKVLYKNENTGAIDVAFDPQNANILFASLWQTRRTPWSLSSGGPGSGVYRSTDGGATWKRLQEQRARASERALWAHRVGGGGEFRARVRAYRGQGRWWTLPLRRRRRHLGSGKRQPLAVSAGLVLHARDRRSAGSKHGVRVGCRVLKVHRRRAQLQIK